MDGFRNCQSVFGELKFIVRCIMMHCVYDVIDE